MAKKDKGTGKLCFLDFEWLPAGVPAIFQDLTGTALRASSAQSQPTNALITVGDMKI